MAALQMSCSGLPGKDNIASLLDYPPARRSDQVDDYHGTRVADPYRWLEALSSPQTQRWVQAENSLTRSRLSALPGREFFAARLRTLIEHEHFGVPQAQGGRYVYTYNTGQLEQDQLWETTDPAQRGRLLLDPNRLAADGSVSIGDFELSRDGRRLAYSLSDSGSDWRNWRILDIGTGEVCPERLDGIKFSGVSWAPDGHGFFYSRYPSSGVSGGYDDTRQVSIWFHETGAAQSSDRFVFAIDDHPTRNPYGRVTDDGRYLVISLFDRYASNGVYLMRLENSRPAGPVMRLFDDWDAQYEFLGNIADRFFFKTTKDAPRGRIIVVRPDRPGPDVRQSVVPQRTEAIDSASLLGESLIVRRKAMPTDRPGPTVLYGYGGFNISLLPRYSISRMAWLEAGGTYAVANLRGGGEYGEAWHEAGTKLNKQHVFDDFIAAAEWLIDNDYTNPSQLAVWGASNGGLLVGAVTIQRPDLFAATIPAVGVMDMLRYHTSSANARQWSSDYGLSENPDEFRALYAYSPVHNLRRGVCYPATLVMADANDDRVAPWNSYKYAAAMQYAQGCNRPVLIRIETRTGHGSGASTSKIVNEYADQWAFLAAELGLGLPP